MSALKDMFQHRPHTELECYHLPHGETVAHKIPLEQWALRNLATQLGIFNTTWADNLNLLADCSQSIEENLRSINKSHHCPRSCVAVHSFEPAKFRETSLLVFLSIGKPVKPIYFRKPDGAEYEFVFESCRLWPVSLLWYIESSVDTKFNTGYDNKAGSG